MEDEGSVLKYMTKSEIEEQRSSLLIMTQRLFVYTRTNPQLISACEQKDDFVRQVKSHASSRMKQDCRFI